MEFSTPEVGASMARVAVIGASSSLGLQVLRALSSSGDVALVLAVDSTPPMVVLPRVQFVRRLPESSLADLFLESWIERVIFLAPELTPGAWPCRPLVSTETALESTLEGCHRAGIGHLVATSTGMVYLPSWDWPAPRLESTPAEGGRAGIEEIRVALRLEQKLADFGAEHPELKVAITRAALTLGPEVTHFFSRILSRRSVWLPSPMAPLGLVEVGDLARALVVLSLTSGSGVFNVVPEDVIGAPELARMLKSEVHNLRAGLLDLVLKGGWYSHLRGITEVPPAVYLWLSAPWILDAGRLRQETGFQFRHSSEETLRLFLKGRGLIRPSGWQTSGGKYDRNIRHRVGSRGTQHSAAPAAGGS